MSTNNKPPISVILALAVAIPMASAKQNENLAGLTAAWANWSSSINPSPLEGSYEGGDQCEGEYVDGVFFLAASVGTDPVERTCTVEPNTTLFFPVSIIICSAAFDPIQEVDDPEPYDTACAEPLADELLDEPSQWRATLDGKKLDLRRIASGEFLWTLEYNNNPIEGLLKGSYWAATDGYWVLVEEGLTPGEHTIVFGGTYHEPGEFRFEGAEVTYHLTAE